MILILTDLRRLPCDRIAFEPELSETSIPDPEDISLVPSSTISMEILFQCLKRQMLSPGDFYLPLDCKYVTFKHFLFNVSVVSSSEISGKLSGQEEMSAFVSELFSPILSSIIIPVFSLLIASLRTFLVSPLLS